ncbi:S1 RNA-binding domain-containing protein 1 [Bagarius yarrelli]|uniref:S1 RNA-binding domain-containing protein 1 n=1 Tax=Bagarius yarrelli TaxID=175774 RepID=A0A556TRC8_BAGYA|nr:S1 RNA-binding domain-containing protein 1 [Bagarius yarrelli]
MLRTRRTVKAKEFPEPSDDELLDSPESEEEPEEWLPEQKTKGRGRMKKGETADKKPATKRAAKPKEAKPKTERKPRASRAVKEKKSEKKEEKSNAVFQKDEPLPQVQIKEEMSSSNAILHEEPSSSTQLPGVKKEEPEDDFTFDEPARKKQKSTSALQGKAVNPKSANTLRDEMQMNWDPVQVLTEKTGVQQWVCGNISQLLREENTIPFMVRYRKELINHMDADSVRDVQHALEELCSVAKKCQSITQTLKKEGGLTFELEKALRDCKSADELEHVYAPYKKGSKLSKARRAKQLGLESAALALLQSPQTLKLHSWIQPNTKGLSTLEEVATGVEQILADMIAKDSETLSYIRSLCDRSDVTIQSSVSKTALKEQQQADQRSKTKDISNFSLYSSFSCNVQRIQHHQTLAINRGENLKILSVKINIPMGEADSVGGGGHRWHLRDDEHLKKCRRGPYRDFSCPYSAEDTGQILHTDVVYLHGPGRHREADKLRHLMLKHSCQTVVIGNGTACRETESFFADLIKSGFFKPLDVSYCITNEAGASIYSVSPEAVKEMPDLDPNLRSAVSIGRRVQDPLAELVKIDPKHIGIGTYQHDVSQTLLRTALDGVVQECVSFVGVDINICSETLMRHVAGLNSGRARSIVEWREKNGPFFNREQLKLVKGLGPKSFQQCAGFIRINPETAHRFLSQMGGSLDQLGSTELEQRVKSTVTSSGLECLASSLNTCPINVDLQRKRITLDLIRVLIALQVTQTFHV